MTLNLAEHKDDLLFLPLGGANEIGANLNLYHYKGKWLMIDCGSGFAEENMPGVDMMVPDISFIKKHKENVLGLILTHSHEDHIGGVQHLWKEIKCPIYATNFTVNFLRTRLNEYNLLQEAQLETITSDKKIHLGPFTVEALGLTHSAPEMQALRVSTDAGKIVHTGDWKFDPDPLVGPQSDLARLRKWGDEGVLGLVCDSTNVFTPGTSGSEGELKKSLTQLISKLDNLIVVTTFASNLARLDTIIKAARENNRKIILAGRSLYRMIEAAEKSGYNLHSEDFVNERDFLNHKRNKLLVLATGCQGEPMAATPKMANGEHPVKLAKGDTIIFSSKIIPGNDKKIFKLFNTFVRKGIEVITERDYFVHVSGHPAIDELKEMYKLVRPTIAVPVHGEPIHIHEHARLAKSLGVKHAIEVENGTVVRMNPISPGIITKVKNGYYGVDGSSLRHCESPIFNLRKRMMTDGIISVSVIINNYYKLVTRPAILYPGALDYPEDKAVINDLHKLLLAHLQKTNYNDKEAMEKGIRKCVRMLVSNERRKNPLIMVSILKLPNSKHLPKTA